MAELKPGITGIEETVVEPPITADGVGNPGAFVLSTTHLAVMFELAALKSVLPHLDPGQGTVGTRLEIKHLAATPLGLRVRAQATLEEVDGRRLVFHLEAHDDREKIAEGVNERFVVDMKRFLDRADQKKSG
ncbi:MAG TPA: hotdog domain-containing protein [Dehalococcoidia bacterium]|nr:hotdog domain-containing protein [Dehalococcoidia bacterium]